MKIMLHFPLKITASLVMLATLGACAVTPSTITQNPGPGSTRTFSGQSAPGTIYSTASYRPIFEGNRARSVGDIVTVVVSESTSSKTTLNNLSSKTSSSAATAKDQFGNTVSPTWNWANDLSNENKGGGQQDNSFTGNIAATVLEVSPSGYLVVAGEKQIGFDEGAQFIRFSGTVNPKMITVNNTVDSSTVADARIEYRTNNTMDSSYMASSITRFFKTMMPF
ncbi:flagellar basal body L-ring protein FlgH [Polynucleobacter paneuropaeus]|jgi:flagellar L-ring protein precursor FlgH|nr:flagellar basal body L-ring protein FlgH [Polynucleobacter paneuropaeus]QWD32945.1 flagellar basal body L-ring protein FlgH [Polynucleobacter paneuropaeus]